MKKWCFIFLLVSLLVLSCGKNEGDKAGSEQASPDQLSSIKFAELVKDAQLKYQQGDYQGALDIYRKAGKINPDNAEVHYGMGMAAFALGDFEGAVVYYDKAIQLSPGFVEAYVDRGAAYLQQGKYFEAKVDASKALQLNPGFPPAEQLLELIEEEQSRI
ncbi:tetratricopeptide repeat protein [bacterium]|nr:tetratricopeptide repeat protein [bacterium]